MNRIRLTLLVLLATAVPAFGYEEDTHYYLCYVTARLAGLSDREAHVVASSAQAIDEAPATTPYKLSNIGSGERDRMKRVLPLWHAMSAGGDEAEITRRMDKLREDALKGKGDLIGLGRFAHFAQDWYSHQPENGRHYTAPTGHLFDGHAPDYLSSDPKKAEEMARAWMKEVAAFIEKTGRTSSVPAGAELDKVLRMTLGKLIWAHQNNLSHQDREKALNEMFQRLGLDIVVPAYDRRLTFAFEEDGTPHAVDPNKDRPPLALRLDAASFRVLDRAAEEQAEAGRGRSDVWRAAVRAMRDLDEARIDAQVLALGDEKVAAMRRQLAELKAERDQLGKDIASLEAEIDRLVSPAKGPCICGAATHSVCKKGKECQDVENGMRNDLVEKVGPKKARRKELAAQIEALLKAIEAEKAALATIGARIASEPIPEDLRKALGPDTVLTRRLRQVLPKLLPYLPSGSVITSGYRSPERQLKVMGDLARQHRIPWSDDAAVDKPETWMPAWHALLAKEVPVNPPVPARKPDGQWSKPVHALGHSFDIGGASLDAIKAGLEKAQEAGVLIVPPFKVETQNGRGCVHVKAGY